MPSEPEKQAQNLRIPSERVEPSAPGRWRIGGDEALVGSRLGGQPLQRLRKDATAGRDRQPPCPCGHPENRKICERWTCPFLADEVLNRGIVWAAIISVCVLAALVVIR